jgi:hypothetical protein
MSQETLYFPHDYNPFDDTQFEALVLKHKAVGYAVFWRLVEMLHANADHILPFENHIYISIASKFSISPEVVEEIIMDCLSEFKLFSADGVYFWSERVLRNIAKRKAIREQKSLAGKASAEKRKKEKDDEDSNTRSTPVQHPLNSVATVFNKERKESKEIYSYIGEK